MRPPSYATDRTARGVPVLIDARRQVPGEGRRAFDMVRCTYLLIESDAPGAGWTINVNETQLPYLLLSLRGVVLGPPEDRGERFTSPDDIDALYDFVEDGAKLLVDVGDIWIPSEAFPKGDSFAVGAGYRVSRDAFEAAVLFRESRIDIVAFLDRMSALAPGAAVVPSPEEGRAFAAWNQRQIGLAVEQYPKSEALELSYAEDEASDETGGEA